MNSGRHLCLHLPPGLSDVDVAARLREQRIFVDALSAAAWQVRSLNGIVLGYGGLNEDRLEQGLRLIARALAQACAAVDYQPAGENA